MSTVQHQMTKTLAPAPAVDPGTPQRLTTDNIFTRSWMIEMPDGNIGKIHIAFSQTDMLSGRRHTLYSPGDVISVDSSEYANLDAELNLRDIWFDGDVAGEELVVSYNEITEPFK